MKNMTTFFAIILAISFCCFTVSRLTAQCKPMILIDGNAIIADENDADGLKLPTWLKAGQSANVGQYVYSISAIEFSVNGAALDYSQNLSITAASTVPSNRVWKIEAVHKNIALPSFSGTYTYDVAGTYTFVSPACSLMVKAQVRGAGGGGGGGYCAGSYYAGAGGGGGGYAEGFYLMPPTTSYTVTVGAGGAGSAYTGTGTTGGTSSVNIVSISATGGVGGQGPNVGTTGGAGGTGSGQLNFTGQKGDNTTVAYTSGKGGNAANSGGAGGSAVTSSASIIPGNPGTGPGGGGSGAATTDCATGIGGAGADGKVVITIGASSGEGGSSTFTAPRDRLQASNIINIAITSSCGYVVPSGKYFRLDGAMGNGNVLYFGSSCSATDRGTMTVYAPISGNTGGNAPTQWPYPMWFKPGTYFYYTASSCYISGVEYSIEP